jgi:hypothetical protein
MGSKRVCYKILFVDCNVISKACSVQVGSFRCVCWGFDVRGWIWTDVSGICELSSDTTYVLDDPDDPPCRFRSDLSDREDGQSTACNLGRRDYNDIHHM